MIQKQIYHTDLWPYLVISCSNYRLQCRKHTTIFMWPHWLTCTANWQRHKHINFTNLLWPSISSKLSVNVCKHVLTCIVVSIRLAVFGLPLPHFSHRAPSLLVRPVPSASSYWTIPSKGLALNAKLHHSCSCLLAHRHLLSDTRTEKLKRKRWKSVEEGFDRIN